MAVKRVPRRRDGYAGGLAVRRPAQRPGFLEGRGGRCPVTATGVVLARGGDDAGEGTRFRREGGVAPAGGGTRLRRGSSRERKRGCGWGVGDKFRFGWRWGGNARDLSGGGNIQIFARQNEIFGRPKRNPERSEFSYFLFPH